MPKEGYNNKRSQRDTRGIMEIMEIWEIWKKRASLVMSE